ncbi:MAG: TrmB family transcriptional regulator [Candidatus Marinimicrobia bacterium]|nr:TrmB family transcriptional regulator [Candidatus Neomarinimicrobiota bacterium]
MNEKLLPALKSFGFTSNEAKTYLSLLKNNPATGYEISGKSGIPRSAIYEILKRLESTGMVSCVDSNPTRYIPLPPDHLFDVLENNFVANLDTLKESLRKVNSDLEVGDLWNIRGYDSMIDRARHMIKNADQSIYLSLWLNEYKKLQTDLLDAEKRGVSIVIFSFCDIPIDVGTVFAYNLDSERLQDVWSSKILMVTDHDSALLGGVDMLPTNKVAWTRNSAIVAIALNYIILDLTLFGQRYEYNMSPVIADMLQGEIHNLDDLLSEDHEAIIHSAKD